MASIVIRKLDESTKELLRIRAAQNGRSMEEEVRFILRAALSAEQAKESNLSDRIRKRFKPLGGLELRLPERAPIRNPPTLD
ncbi:MAG: hypothetical protein U0103_04440 [Candidatus Obscuribacterales bacterium]